MNIRNHIAEKDTDLYIEAERESFKAAYPGVAITAEKEEYFNLSATQRYTDSQYQAFTLLDNDLPVGMVSIHIREKAPRPTCYVANIYIQSSHRGTDAFLLLLGAAEQLEKEVGAQSITLDVSTQNERALSAYKKQGFKTTHLSMEKML